MGNVRHLARWFYSLTPKDAKWKKLRASPTFKRRQSLVKSFWIVSGLIMLASANIYAISALALFTTFVSFMVLYETDL